MNIEHYLFFLLFLQVPISFTIISLSSSDKFFLESRFIIRNYYYILEKILLVNYYFGENIYAVIFYDGNYYYSHKESIGATAGIL